MVVKSPEESVSLSEYAYREVRDAIREGRFPPSRRLRENDISEMLGISRTPVREAMKRLEAERLVVYRAPRGFVVNSLEPEEVIELYAMREILEGTAARFAATYTSALELKEIERLLELQRNVCENPAKMAQLNEEFHRAIYQAARNRYLISALNSLGDAMKLLVTTTYATPGRGRAGFKEHQKIFEAIAKRDADMADRRAREHIVNASSIRLKMTSESNMGSRNKLAASRSGR